VAKGQPLAHLDSTNFEAALLASKGALASAKARLERAKATMQLKKQNLKRLKQAVSLSKGQALSRNDLELAEAELKIAKAETTDAQAAIQQAEANLKVDETNLSKTIIVSPIDGMVLMRNVDPGQTVAASLQAPVLFTLAEDLAQMELQVDVDEADVGKVAAGQWATFVVDAYPNRQFSAVITQVRYGAQSTNGVVTYKTLLRVDNPDLVLRPGMTATADIMIQEIKNAVLVPNAAFRFTPPAGISDNQQQGQKQGFFSKLTSGTQEKETKNTDRENKNKVWILKGGRPVPMEVTTGPTNGTLTVIEDDSDLKPGTPLVVDVVEVSS
jgi:HlyD family secretion protein